MDLTKAAVSVAIMTAITVFTRVFPFLFYRNRELPPVLIYIQRYIPPIIMTVLVIYCLNGVNWAEAPRGVPEIICILVTAVLHLWKRNPLISIFGGTILYMVLVQTDVVMKLFY
jgi:branched-subunit amino acid transport protein AzlD